MRRVYQAPGTETRTDRARLPIQTGRLETGESQESMADLLAVDARTLRRYESGELPTPDDVMLRVAEMAEDPLLLYQHFKGKYHISDDMLPPVEAVPLAVAVVNLLTELDRLERGRVASRLLELARDGIIEPGEAEDYRMIMKQLDGVRRAVELLRYYRREG